MAAPTLTQTTKHHLLPPDDFSPSEEGTFRSGEFTSTEPGGARGNTFEKPALFILSKKPPLLLLLAAVTGSVPEGPPQGIQPLSEVRGGELGADEGRR